MAATTNAPTAAIPVRHQGLTSNAAIATSTDATVTRATGVTRTASSVVACCGGSASFKKALPIRISAKTHLRPSAFWRRLHLSFVIGHSRTNKTLVLSGWIAIGRRGLLASSDANCHW